MRQILLSFIASFCFWAATAQTSEVVIEHKRTSHMALKMELSYPPEVVEKALDDFMAGKGVKGNNSNSLRVYRNIKLHSTHDHNSDLHFKIERKSKQEKDVTIIHLIIAGNNEDLKTKKYADNSALHGGKELLEEFAPTAEAHNLEVNISAQEETVTKTEKKYNNLVEDQKDMEKKIKDLQEKIEENKKNQEKLKLETEKQKQLLEAMRSRRKH